MLWVHLSPEVRPAPDALGGAVPAGWHFCRTLTVRASAGTAREALERSGLTEGPTAPGWRGRLGDTEAVALVLDAQPGLAFIHLWTEALPGSAAMKALHTATRQLRTEIEALPQG